MPAHLEGTSPNALVTNASTTVMGAVSQKRKQHAWNLLAFFSKKMKPAKKKYNAYDQELLLSTWL